MKAIHQKPGGLLHKIQVLGLKWEYINMNFVVGLPQTRRENDSIWVVGDMLTKFDQFIPINYLYSAEEYAMIYINKIVSLHSIPLSIISDRGSKITSQF